jgi:hypothetical protein
MDFPLLLRVSLGRRCPRCGSRFVSKGRTAHYRCDTCEDRFVGLRIGPVRLAAAVSLSSAPGAVSSDPVSESLRADDMNGQGRTAFSFLGARIGPGSEVEVTAAALIDVGRSHLSQAIKEARR